MTEVQYQQNELNRLMHRRGDLDTMLDDLAAEKADVIAAIGEKRRRIQQLLAATPVPAPAQDETAAPAKEPTEELPRLRKVLADEAERSAQ